MTKKICNIKAWISKPQPAFMLVEVMVAFTLLCITTLLVAHMQGRVIRYARNAATIQRAIMLARQELELLILDPKTATHSVKRIQHFLITKTIKPMVLVCDTSVNLTANFAKKMAHVCVRVAWNADSGRQRHVEFDSLCVVAESL